MEEEIEDLEDQLVVFEGIIDQLNYCDSPAQREVVIAI